MTTNNKPLHKDLSFWIVAVVLVGAASGAQLYYGIPWFGERLAQARPAHRIEHWDEPTPVVRRNPGSDSTNKTFSWPTPRLATPVLNDTSPQPVVGKESPTP